MGKKPIKSFDDLGDLVFSTDKDLPVEEEILPETPLAPSEQFLEAHFSNKGRGGKTVTVVKGFSGSETEIKLLAKQIKTAIGVGGSVKNGEIIIQGNFRDKIIKWLEERSYNVKRVGG
ncbi:translation initiation factor [Ascidiimonas aurantiaca]|uniref:translation initiation factor n=1 Tax=Ascidiimonas aurantiaca TaxID=1685432 RepID=UPI0030EE695C